MDLDPQFLTHEVRIETRRHHKADGYEADPAHVHSDECFEERTGPCEFNHYVDDAASAQGIIFLCPKCFAANGGPVGTHGVLCWFKDRGVPDEAVPGPARWIATGVGYADLTLAPSILLTGAGCAWHGFVTNGEVTSC